MPHEGIRAAAGFGYSGNGTPEMGIVERGT